MTYPRNAASPERIAIGPVILIADGTPQSSGVVVTVRGQGGAEAGSAGTIAYGATGVIVYYTPTQAETDFTSFTLVASKANCIPACVTIVTSASATPGHVGTDQGKIANPTSTVGLTNTTVGVVTLTNTLTTYTGNTPQTGDAFARLGAPAGASVSADVAAVKVDTAATLADTGTDGVVVAAASKTGYSLTATTGLGNQTANITGNLSGSVGSVTGAVGSVTGAVGSVTGAVGSVTAEVTANVTKISGSTAAADNLEESTEAIGYGTVDGTGATTTVFLSSALTPDSAVNDQFNGRVLIFKSDTTTAALRGQATTISDYAHTSAEIGTFTVVALTTAPATGDTFVIL